MKIAVLGTGPVGQTIAAALSALGHQVVLGTRDPATTMARTEPGAFGTPAFPTWKQDHPDVDLATLADAVSRAELVVNATNGAGSLATLDAAGADALADKVILDLANTLDFSQGMPPSLLVSNTDSLGEQIQRRFPRAKVVKALNTMNVSLMVDPMQLAGGDHTCFVSGDDASAKQTVVKLLTALGHRDIIDLGGIATARGAEMYLPLWLGLMSALGTPTFSIKVVR